MNTNSFVERIYFKVKASEEKRVYDDEMKELMNIEWNESKIEKIIEIIKWMTEKDSKEHGREYAKICLCEYQVKALEKMVKAMRYRIKAKDFERNYWKREQIIYKKVKEILESPWKS